MMNVEKRILQEIFDNKVEELRKIRFQHSKNCQIPLDKCDVAKEYDLLIDVLEWV